MIHLEKARYKSPMGGRQLSREGREASRLEMGVNSLTSSQVGYGDRSAPDPGPEDTIGGRLKKTSPLEHV